MIDSYETELIEFLRNKLLKSDSENFSLPSDKQFKIAAVLVPVAIYNQEAALLFTKRSNQLKNHSGQVSFPGGHMELCDRDLQETALRETREEIGINPEQIEILGNLKPVLSTTGYFIHSYVGYIKDLQEIHENLDEVERIFCIPLMWLLDPENSYQRGYQTATGDIRKVWFFKEYDEEKVWGITAGITRQLIDLINN